MYVEAVLGEVPEWIVGDPYEGRAEFWPLCGRAAARRVARSKRPYPASQWIVNIENSIALVTGANRGLGKVYTDALHDPWPPNATGF